MVLRLLIPFLLIAFSTCFYIDKQNRSTQLGVELSRLSKEIEGLKQTNEQIWYRIKCFESPDHLLKLTSLPEYSHLEFPAEREIVMIKAKRTTPLISEMESLQQIETSNNPQAGLVFATKR